MDEENRVELDGSGNFKSLGDQLDYFAEFPNIPKEEGSPNPFEYGPGENERFSEDLSTYKQKKLIQEAVKEALPQTPQKPTIEFSPEVQREMDEQEKFAKLEGEIVLLGESRLDSEKWHDPIVQKEYSEKVHAWNQKNQKNVFLLPKEDSEFGNTLPLRPGNCVIVEVPKEVAEEVRRAVYQGQGGYGGRNRFEQLWASLHRLGFSSGKMPTILFPEQSKESEKKKSVEDRWGSQKKFEEWRMKEGARR